MTEKDLLPYNELLAEVERLRKLEAVAAERDRWRAVMEELVMVAGNAIPAPGDGMENALRAADELLTAFATPPPPPTAPAPPA